jgi:hypothetical protein
VHHEEALKPSAALAKIGDALPGLGIVAAVLGMDPRTSSHPEHPLGGAAFTWDDELEMHELLSSETWFSDFVAQ